jgi:DNA-binding CsgD family transcriptional regulator
VNQRLEPDLFDFPLAIRKLCSGRAVGEALVRMLRPFGMTTFAIGACPLPGNAGTSAFHVDNWPAEWRDAYHSEGMAEYDPILRAVRHNSTPVSVREIRAGRAGFVLQAEEQVVLNVGARLGRTNGLVVPIHGAQGYHGFAYVCGPGPDPDARVRVVLQFLLWHAHDQLRALHASAPGAAPAHLSQREREILVAARRGLGDDEIAEAMGITVRTVRFHFENVRRKLAARNRTEAIAKAVQVQLLGV